MPLFNSSKINNNTTNTIPQSFHHSDIKKYSFNNKKNITSSSLLKKALANRINPRTVGQRIEISAPIPIIPEHNKNSSKDFVTRKNSSESETLKTLNENNQTIKRINENPLENKESILNQHEETDLKIFKPFNLNETNFKKIQNEKNEILKAKKSLKSTPDLNYNLEELIQEIRQNTPSEKSKNHEGLNINTIELDNPMSTSILANPAWYRDDNGRTGFRSLEMNNMPNLQQITIKEANLEIEKVS